MLIKKIVVVFARHCSFRRYLEKREFPILDFNIGFSRLRPLFFFKKRCLGVTKYIPRIGMTIPFHQCTERLGPMYLSRQKCTSNIDSVENMHTNMPLFCVQGQITLPIFIFWNCFLLCISTDMFSYVFHWDSMTFEKIWLYRGFPMKPLHRQNREFPFFEISCKPTMLQRNDYDFRNQRKILVLEMFEILGAQTLTKILLHCVIVELLNNSSSTSIIIVVSVNYWDWMTSTERRKEKQTSSC